MTVSKNNKMLAHLNYKMRVILQDSRAFVGQFLAFDKHMNVILSDCEEFRRAKPKKGSDQKETMRPLGLVLLRGQNIVSMIVEAPPAAQDQGPRVHVSGAAPGSGMARAAGRGMSGPSGGMGAPAGLSGPVRGVGGPSSSMMAPGGGYGSGGSGGYGSGGYGGSYGGGSSGGYGRPPRF